MTSPEFLHACRAILGAGQVITAPEEMAPYLTDWRGRFAGSAAAVLRPADTNQVAAIIALCAEAKVPVVPQGGNTGLVVGSVPDLAGNAVVRSLKRMNRIRA